MIENALALLLAIATTGSTPPFQAPCLSLKEMRRFGHEDHPVGTDAGSPQGSAGVLGNVRGVVVGPSGLVFVLDRYFQKIVAYRPDGSVERVIRGGSGEGPGEFRLPMHLNPTARGLSVLDYDLRRITEFDWSGKLLRTMRVPTQPPWGHLQRGDTVWITYGSSGSSSDPVFHIVTQDGSKAAPGPPLQKQDQPFGGGAGAVVGAAGEILVNTARPGVWMAYEKGSWSRRGTPLFRKDDPPLTEQTGPRQWRVTPAEHTAGGLAMIGDSIVLQGFVSLPRPFDWNDPPRRDEFLSSLGIYRRNGQHLATIQLPAGTTTAYLTADRTSGRIFLPTNDPFPQAIEYALVHCANPR